MQEKKILQVEDSDADSELIVRHLRGLRVPFRLKRVDSLANFLQQITTTSPDLILADFRVPGIGALDVLDVLKERRLDIQTELAGEHRELGCIAILIGGR